MSASIEDRVVSMSFENTKFQAGVSQTMSSIDKLNAALKNVGTTSGLDNIEKSASKITFGPLGSAIDKIKQKLGFQGAGKGLQDIETAGNNVKFGGLSGVLDRIKTKFGFGKTAASEFASVERSSGTVRLAGLSNALDGVKAKFSILQGAASVALGNIAAMAVQKGGMVLKALTLDPIMEGFKNYETQINAVQTILANTGLTGKRGLDKVNASLKQLNDYANLTVYNFSEMARNIGTFTAAGVDLKTATASIKGIANLAALSGSNSQQASTAMYQLSQAIAAGQVHLQDWNSVVNAGMGGTVFQRALAQTAEKMGTLKDGAVKLVGPMKNVSINGNSFRQALQTKPGEKSWLTSKVLTTTLKEFTGDLSKAQLAAIGFSDAQIKAIQKQAKVAVGAATNIKTLSQLFQALKEEVASAWSAVFKTLFGDITHATSMFTKLHNILQNALTKPINDFNKVLEGWAKLGGKQAFFQGIKNALSDIGAIIKPIHDAFREIFPPQTAASLTAASKAFENFTAKLKIGPQTADNLKATFKGLFAVLDVGKQILGGIFTALGHVFGAAGKGSGGILALTGAVGNLLVKFDEWLKKGDKVKTVFAGLGDVLSVPLRLLGQLASKLQSVFSGNVGGGAASALRGVSNSLKPAAGAADAASKAWGSFLKILEQVGHALQPVVKSVGDAFSKIGDAIATGISHANFDTALKALNTGLIAGIFITLKKAIGGGFDLGKLLGLNQLKKVSGSLDVLQASLISIQRNIQAHVLATIATAVALLAASVVALSFVNPKKLTSAMTAITVGMAQLIGASAAISKLGGSAVKMTAISGSLILLATAMDVLSGAVLVLSRLSWGELAKGLSGVAALLAVVSIAIRPLSSAGPGLVLAGAGLIAVGTGLTVLAAPIKLFSMMKWEELGKGLAGVAAALLAVGVASRAMPLTLPLTGAGLILVGAGLAAVAGAVRIFATMDWKTLGKGIAAVAASLVVIGLAMEAMPMTLPLTAAGLILVGIGLTGVAGAIAILGHMSFGTLAKGIAAMAAALAVLAVGMTAMVASLPGAAAMLVVSAALAIFVPVLGLLGNMSWGTIAKGLAAIAASFVVIGTAGLVAVPALIGLGAGLAALGLGVLAVGLGVKLLASGIAVLADKGGKGLAIFVAAMTLVITSFPKMLISFTQGLVGIAGSIVALAPKLVGAIAAILNSMLQAVILSSPKFAQATTALITAMLTILAQNAGPIIAAGWKLLIQLLQGISSHISQVTTTVESIVTKFLNALASRAGQLVSAGANALVAFLRGISNNLSRVVSAAGDVIARYVAAVGGQLSKVVTAGVGIVTKLVSGIASNASRVVSAGVNALISFIAGVGKNIANVATKGVEIATHLINAVTHAVLRMADAGAQALISFMHGVATAIRKYEPQLIAAGADIGTAIITGLVNGMAAEAGKPVAKAEEIAGKILHILKKVPLIHSPSQVTTEIGANIIRGLALGMANTAPLTENAASAIGNSVIAKFKTIFGIQSPSTVMASIGQFVGQGFHDGLLGSTSDIDNAMQTLTNKINSSLKTANESVDAARKRLQTLEDAKHKNKKAISDADEVLAKDTAFVQALTRAHDAMYGSLDKQAKKLKDLSANYADITQKLQDAQDQLASLKQDKASFIQNITDQYGSLPDIVQSMTDAEGNTVPVADQLSPYVTALGNATDAVAAYHDVLDQLRTLGLDDTTLRKLVQDGPADMQFAQQLLAGGQAAIANLNQLDQSLTTQANTLATDAGNALYNVGIQYTAGIIKGLEEKQSDLHKAIEAMAVDMIKTIRKKLKMKSPSQEMMEVGRLSSEGLVVGLQNSSGLVAAAAASIGDEALMALRDSMSRMSDAIMSEVDVNPTITPVLDLSQIKAGAKEMAGVLPSASYGLAGSIAAEQNGSSDPGNSPGGQSGRTIQFIQNNTSPKSLSETEIYRQTNNQLSQAKSVLGL